MAEKFSLVNHSHHFKKQKRNSVFIFSTKSGIFKTATSCGVVVYHQPLEDSVCFFDLLLFRAKYLLECHCRYQDILPQHIQPRGFSTVLEFKKAESHSMRQNVKKQSNRSKWNFSASLLRFKVRRGWDWSKFFNLFLFRFNWRSTNKKNENKLENLFYVQGKIDQSKKWCPRGK